MLHLIIDLLSAAFYLLIGTFYAKANSYRCYEEAARRWAKKGPDLVTQSYWERIALHVAAWPIVWPVRRIARAVSAPVGDFELTYRLWVQSQEQINLGRKELER